MLERQEQTPQSQGQSGSQKMTQLEGIRQKVFIDRYSLKDASGQPLEFYPEQLWARVARGIAAVEPTEEQRAHWEQRFYEALSDFQFVPGGRILAGAGSGHQVTFYNCLSGDTLVHTRRGLVPIGSLQGEYEVLSEGSIYRTAFFKSYGKQRLWEVNLANGTTIYATGDHQWVVTKEKGGTERVLTRDLVGRRIPINPRPAPDYDSDFSEGVRHGIVYGDGSVQYGKAHVCLFGEKEQLADWFGSYGYKQSGGTVATRQHIRIQGLPAVWKELPSGNVSASYWRGFVAGLIATDGHVDERGSVATYNRDRETLARIAEGMAIAGFVSSGITMTRETSPYNGEEKPIYQLQLFKATINERDILHPLHLENFLRSPRARNASIRVESTRETDRYEEVFCCVEPETHTITISHGYLTGQCYVTPSPEDSRQGILDNLKVMTEIMARGGGVGINLSTLRPRGSYIKTVNGTASGPCSWAQLYSVATGDVIQQGGCFGPDERIATDRGLIRAKELADRLDRGEPIQAQTHKGLRPFTHAFRNGIKDLYEVTTSRGYRVRVTLDHKMGVLRTSRIATIPLRELQEGDEILLLLGEGVENDTPPVPLSSRPQQVAVGGGVATVERPDTLPGLLPDAIISVKLIGPSEVYDFEVEDVHLLAAEGVYTANSRRGALMLMLDDTHPDIEEFITVKRTPGKIEHANLSVCISDAFMQAVKDDADWKLTWQGEVKKTVRARKLWDLICTSAWESAEPGMVFMDRYNKESNTWYYEDIRCVNPCITGDTLIYTSEGLIPAKELAETGLPVKVVSPDITVKELALAGHAIGSEQFTVTSPLKSVSLRQASHVFTSGIKPVYQLQTKEGYTLRLTGDHKVLTTKGWKPALDLVVGDKIHVLHGEGGFGTSGSEDLGRVLGWLIGDGYINRQRDQSKSCVTLSFFGTEQSIAPNLAEAVNRLVAPLEGQRRYLVGVQKIAERQESRVESVRLLRLIDPELLENKLQVPPSVLRGSREMQKGFLAALFTADGSVQGTMEKGISVRLTSVSQGLLEGVQRILLNFGIASSLYKNRRKAAIRELPDSKRVAASYNCQAYHDLMISKGNLRTFAKEIGFLTLEKQSKLEDGLALFTRGPYCEDFLATFESLTPDGEERVYDLTEPEAHQFVANGLVISNCGEQGLPPWGVCNLGALNLSAFVKNGQMDWERLAEVSKVAMRFLDNAIDANEYFIEENRQAQLGTRRTGLGTMGLADALIKMKIAYGSEASVSVIERIYSTIRDAAYEVSADIAAEKGPFPRFDRDKYMQGQFIKRLPKATQAKIKQQGIRNAVLLTQAPTGTTSLLAGVSSGIEPVYDFAMVRRDRTGEHILYHPLLQEWRDKHPNEQTPDYFVASNDLTPEEHVRVQATIQKYTDSSISKTVNAPNSHTVEQVQTLYRLAYEMGCKGITYYRDGSRDAVLTRVEDEKKQEQEKQAPMIEPVTSIQHGIKPRPAVVQGYTRQVSAPEGKINITINSDDHGPLEVFVNVGKAGSDIAALAEALGRLISLNLRVLSPLSQTDRAKEIAEQLRGIGGSRSVGFGMQQVRSLPDAVARALELHLEQMEAAKEKSTSSSTSDKQVSNGNAAHVDPPAAPLNLTHLSVTGNLCPQCGCNTMVHEEGCKKCYSCGHSEC